MSYRPDPDNLRAHPDRNKALIRQSLAEVGAGRSILVGGENTIIAGNGVYEQARALGLTIREVEAAPDELIAVRRSDLVGDAARRAAFYDNAASDTSYFDSELLAAALRETPQIVGGVLSDDELAGIIGDAWMEIPEGDAETPFSEFPPVTPDDQFVPFGFGDYRGRVGRVVYDTFVMAYRQHQQESSEPMLDDVLRGWLGV